MCAYTYLCYVIMLTRLIAHLSHEIFISCVFLYVCSQYILFKGGGKIRDDKKQRVLYSCPWTEFWRSTMLWFFSNYHRNPRTFYLRIDTVNHLTHQKCFDLLLLVLMKNRAQYKYAHVFPKIYTYTLHSAFSNQVSENSDVQDWRQLARFFIAKNSQARVRIRYYYGVGTCYIQDEV